MVSNRSHAELREIDHTLSYPCERTWSRGAFAIITAQKSAKYGACVARSSNILRNDDCGNLKACPTNSSSFATGASCSFALVGTLPALENSRRVDHLIGDGRIGLSLFTCTYAIRKPTIGKEARLRVLCVVVVSLRPHNVGSTEMNRRMYDVNCKSIS